jgi:hypothetical protein
VEEDNVYETEVETYVSDRVTGQWKRTWVLMPVWKAKQRRDVVSRCKECHASVKLMKAGPDGQPAAHAEHFRKFEGCSLSMAYEGQRSPNPDAIE